MKKWLIRFLWLAIALTAAMYLLEGGFHVSTIGRGELEKTVPGNIRVEQPCIVSVMDKKDVAVTVYRDLDSADNYYILEFSKNLLFDRFAMTEVHQWDRPQEVFRTVVSSPLRNYGYQVNIKEGTAQISDGSLDDHLPRFLVSFVLCLVISTIVQREKKNK